MELELMRDELKEDKRKVERNENELRKEERKIDELNENLKQASSRLVDKNKVSCLLLFIGPLIFIVSLKS